MTSKNRYLILALALIISSCSSIADMQFWKSDDVEDDPTKPAELKEFKNEVDINIAWLSKFNNEEYSKLEYIKPIVDIPKKSNNIKQIQYELNLGI